MIRVHCPGAYEAVLATVVRETLRDPYSTLRDWTDEERAEAMRVEEELIAIEIEQLRGTTLVAHSNMLPDDLPPPFERFPGYQRGFTVSPDDIITLDEGE